MKPTFYPINEDLLVKHLLGEANQGESQQVVGWIEADPANRKYYEELKKVWEESRRLAIVSNIDEEAAWARFQSRVKPKQAIVRRLDSRLWSRRTIACFGLTLD